MTEKFEASKEWIILILFILILATYFYQTFYYWDYMVDDAYITFRYSRFLAMGRGPYYNIGEHVEGYSNPFFMFLMALIIWLFGDQLPVVASAAKSIGIVSGLLGLLFSFLLYQYIFENTRLSKPAPIFWGLGVMGIIAVNPSYALNSTSGLETMLFSCCITLGVVLATIEQTHIRWRGSGILFVIVVLTRPEGIFLFTVFWLAQVSVALVQQIRRAASITFRNILRTIFREKWFRICFLNGLLVSMFFGLHLLFRYTYYDGEWLPNTYYAKAGGALTGASLYIYEGLTPSLFGFIGLGFSALGFWFAKRLFPALFPLGAIVIAGCLLPLLTGTDWMPGYRFIIPFFPLTATFIVIGWSLLLNKLMFRYQGVACMLIICALPVLWFLQHNRREEFHDYVTIRALGAETGHIALAAWLQEERAQPGDTIALMDIGVIGYLCIDQYILDISGLTDRFIAKSEGAFMDKIYNLDYILKRHPQFIVLIITYPGQAYRAPSGRTAIKFWTSIEAQMYLNPEFQTYYRHQRHLNVQDPSWLDVCAADLGAEKIFEYAHPQPYLLTVFRYKHPSIQE